MNVKKEKKKEKEKEKKISPGNDRKGSCRPRTTTFPFGVNFSFGVSCSESRLLHYWIEHEGKQVEPKSEKKKNAILG